MVQHYKRVGYWWSEKKSQKINIQELARLFHLKGYEFEKIELDQDLEKQGPFDAIIHKLSDVMCKADRDENAARQISLFETYCRNHPEMIVLDTLDNIRKVLDRYRQYKIVEDSELAKEDHVFIPTFVEMTSTDVDENLAKMKASNVQFPFVCKSILAHGTKYAHKMSIIFNEKGLKDINPPCVAQTFINHNARLFKLFIIKDKYFVIERPSIKNFKPNGDYETVHFDSHDISKPYSSCALTELDEEDAKACNTGEPVKERLDKIFNVVSAELGLYLLGIDVIIENETGRYAIIDMNAFPGYDGVHNFLELYRDIVIHEIEAKFTEKTQSSCQGSPNIAIPSSSIALTTNGDIRQPNPPPPPSKIGESGKNSNSSNTNNNSKSATTTSYDFDSGIDTSDSCDERKQKSDTRALPTKLNKKYHCRVQTSSSGISSCSANSSSNLKTELSSLTEKGNE